MSSEPARPASAYDRLVDRHGDVTTWPTSKKAALVMAMAIPFQATTWALVVLQSDAIADIVDTPSLQLHTGAFAVAVLTLF